MPWYKSWYHFEKNNQMSVVTIWKYEGYQLLPMCHVQIEVRIELIKFSASGYLLGYF